MAQEFLDRADVVAVFEQVRGKGVPKEPAFTAEHAESAETNGGTLSRNNPEGRLPSPMGSRLPGSTGMHCFALRSPRSQR